MFVIKNDGTEWIISLPNGVVIKRFDAGLYDENDVKAYIENVLTD